MIYQVQELAGRKWWPVRTFTDIEEAEKFCRWMATPYTKTRIVWIKAALDAQDR